MILDATLLDDLTCLEADVCIVGAGPAGIVTALEIVRFGLRVLLIEAGDLQTAEHPDALLVNTPSSHPAYAQTVRQGLGGTTSVWAGRCVELDAIDFSVRPHVPGSGWPLDHATLSNHYSSAARYCDAQSGDIDLDQPDTELVRHIGSSLHCSGIERWSPPLRFDKRYRGALEAETKITVLLNCQCTRIQLNAESRIVAGAELVTRNHRSLVARAREYLLCGGGLATTRLLLASNDVDPLGLGNTGDALGRYYMGHVFGSIATIEPSCVLKKKLLGFRKNSRGVYYRRRLALTDTIQRDNELLNTAFYPDTPKAANPEHRSALLSAAYLTLQLPYLKDRLAPPVLRDLFLGDTNDSAWPLHVRNLIVDFPRLLAQAPLAVSSLFLSNRRLPALIPELVNNRYDLHYHAEQLPQSGNRIRLIEQRDRFGMPMAAINMQYADRDFTSVQQSHELLIASLAAAGDPSRVRFKSTDPGRAIAAQASDGYHQIGTTRMAASERDGVVDAKCRVYGVKNLSIGSSSVFPTSGQANPTLSVVALCVMIASRLGRELSSHISVGTP